MIDYYAHTTKGKIDRELEDAYTYWFLGDDGELAGVDALLGELPRRVPLRAGSLVVRSGGGTCSIEGTQGEGRGTYRRDTAAEDDVLEVPSHHPTRRQAAGRLRGETTRSRRAPTDVWKRE